MRDNDLINDTLEENSSVSKSLHYLLDKIASGVVKTNEIRKQDFEIKKQEYDLKKTEQTELWKDVKDIKINVSRINEDLYRESDVRPGILQKIQIIEVKTSKIEKVYFIMLGALLLINAIPVIKNFFTLLMK